MDKTELMAQLEQQLRGHDWYFNYSDDHRYYTRGRNQRQAIADTMAKLEQLGAEQEAKELFNDLSPDGFGYG